MAQQTSQENRAFHSLPKWGSVSSTIGLAVLVVVLSASIAWSRPVPSTVRRARAAAPPVAVTFPNRKIFLSPYNWRVPGDGTLWAPSSGGPYFKFSIIGTTKILANVDTTINAGVRPTDMPALKVIVDGKPAAFVQLGTSAKRVTLASGLTTRSHTVLVYAVLGGGGKNGWSATNAQLHIRSLQFDAGATLSSFPRIRRKNCLIFGDSFLAGYSGQTYRSGTTPFYTVADPSLSWAVPLGQALGCEVGVVGIAGSGYLQPGALGFPALSGYWNHYDSTHVRRLSPAPDYTISALGNNDHRFIGNRKAFSPAEVEKAVRNWLTAVRSTLPRTKIFLYVPVGGEALDEDGTGGANATQIRNAVKAQRDANVFLIDPGAHLVSSDNWKTPTWFAPNDGIHPGKAGQDVLAEIAIQQIRKALRSRLVPVSTATAAAQ